MSSFHCCCCCCCWLPAAAAGCLLLLLLLLLLLAACCWWCQACLAQCLADEDCFSTNFDSRCHLYGSVSNGNLPLAGGEGCYNKLVVGGGPNRVLANADLTAPVQ